MYVDRQRFREDGYLILRQVIPSSQLDGMRQSAEVLLARQKAIWARERQPGDPPGGVWETSAQPRLVNYHTLIDTATANMVELWLHPNTLGVSRQLLSVPAAASVFGMMMMCNPVRDHGPANWHRDVHPIDMAPLAGLQSDLLENGPRYLQWNIPLFDDDVLWVIPGSHRRLNTDQENRHLQADAKAPLPGGIPVELKAGDGVVYVNYLLHWGSAYNAGLRRTIHGGHAIFPFFPDLAFAQHLLPAARDTFTDWGRQSARLQDLTERALRAVLDRDADGYMAALQALQPGVGTEGKRVLTIYLSKAAYHIHILKQPDLAQVPEAARRRAGHPHTITLNWGPQFAERFTEAQADQLWQRFAGLDARLQADQEQFVPGFQSGPMRYYFNEMPADLAVEELVAAG